MNPLVWIGVGLLLGVIELFSTTFVLMWIGIAAVIAGLVSFGLHAFGEQVGVFGLLSILLLALTRPLAKRWREKRNGNGYVSDIEHLVGEKALVISRMRDGGTGMVRVGADVWSARCDSPNVSVDAGEWVEVKGVRSSTLIVKTLDRSQ